MIAFARTFGLGLVSMLVLAACEARTVELLPSTIDAATTTTFERPCLNGTVECSGCNVAACSAVCAPAGVCTPTVIDMTNVVCGDGMGCGLAASTLQFCTGPGSVCALTVTNAAEVSCLSGLCRLRCEGNCLIDCPQGNCLLDCLAGGDCRFRTCPETIIDCGGVRHACAASCTG